MNIMPKKLLIFNATTYFILLFLPMQGRASADVPGPNMDASMLHFDSNPAMSFGGAADRACNADLQSAPDAQTHSLISRCEDSSMDSPSPSLPKLTQFIWSNDPLPAVAPMKRVYSKKELQEILHLKMSRKDVLELFSEYHDPLPTTLRERRQAWKHAPPKLELFSLIPAVPNGTREKTDSIIFYYQGDIPAPTQQRKWIPQGFRLFFNANDELVHAQFLECSDKGNMNVAAIELAQ